MHIFKAQNADCKKNRIIAQLKTMERISCIFGLVYCYSCKHEIKHYYHWLAVLEAEYIYMRCMCKQTK